MARMHVLLAIGLSSAVACGGAGGGGALPAQAPGAPTSAPVAGGNPEAPVPAPSASTSVPATPTTPSAAPVHVEMKAPVASAMAADLQALGIDAGSLPPIEKLDPKALRGVMKLFARSLGVKCADCHAEGDFAAPTRRKKIAARMWNEFAAKLTLADGSPLFCDSCHQARIVQLDRTDKKALAKWMEASFVDGLKRRDGKAEECESCHVDQDMHFLAKWAR